MDDTQFDQAFIASAFNAIGDQGWLRLSLVDAARLAGLPVERARARFPGRSALLLRFGLLADQAALAEVESDGLVRDRLFGLLMRRIDVLQAHRGGVLALLRSLPMDPASAWLLASANMRSMGWLLEAAGCGSVSGPGGVLRCKGLLAVWAWTVNTWRRDESTDLSATMSALDTALKRAETAAAWLGGAARPRPAAEDLTQITPLEPPSPPESPFI